MPDRTPQPGPDDEQAASSGTGPRFAWVPGSELSDDELQPGAVVGGAAAADGGVWPEGLDYQTLLEALAAGGFLDGRGEDQDELLADELAAAEDGRMGPPDPARTAALAVEHMDPGPAMAGWLELAAQASGRLDENELAGVAIAAQQLASRAQAAGLAAVAQITARAAAADPEIGVRDDGRPARLCRDALGQVSLALMLTDYSANAWADLAITLSWRLPATGAALARGAIDLTRARLIAEATSVLTEEAARAVQDKILPEAGSQTQARLRARLRQAVIAADPEGAERRRKEAERAARVSLYGDDDGTATLTGTGLPAVQAAAAMARITAIARAMKAAGQAGGLDLHRAKVMLGLLLGTLPYIPPAEGAAPDQPAPGDDGPGGSPGGGRDGGAAGPGGGLPDDLPPPQDEDAPPDDGLGDDGLGDDGLGDDGTDQAGPWDPAEEDDDLAGTGPAPQWPALGMIPSALARPGAPGDGRPSGGLLDVTLPWTTLAGLPGGPGMLGRVGPITPAQARQLVRAAGNDPAAQWRVIVTNAAGQAIAVTRLRRRRIRTGHGPPGGSPPGGGPPPGAGLVGRITLTVSQDTLREQARGSPGRSDPPGGIAATALRAAARALDRALAQGIDEATAGGCVHASESAAYRPPPRLREHVIARDVTCRFRTCGQPAWRADLDHTIPYDQQGRTCRCNLGGACRKHHQLKQHPRWKLEQTRPGGFTWTTPAGRTYITGPDTHPL